MTNSTVYWPPNGCELASGSRSHRVQIVGMPSSAARTATNITTPATNWMTNCPKSVSASAQRPPTWSRRG